MKKIISLTTDFGVKDHYVGVMKGVILSINEDANIVDITHEIDSHSVAPAAFIISASYYYFRPKSIHVVVVDPGVGSSRRAVLVCADGHYFIGPDNGVFSLLYKNSSDYEIFELENMKYFQHPVSSTFHGRDIFSSCAAHLSCGVQPSGFGRKIDDPVKIDLKQFEKQDGYIKGHIIYTDRFGNLVTNIPSDIVNNDSEIKVGDMTISGISDFYSSVKKGDLLAICGSSGYLEISVNNGSARNLIDEDNIEIIINN